MHRPLSIIDADIARANLNAKRLDPEHGPDLADWWAQAHARLNRLLVEREAAELGRAALSSPADLIDRLEVQ